MKKFQIAFIGHSHHTTTRSSVFFVEILKSIGTVHFFWDESWKENGNAIKTKDILEGNYDIIVVFQVEHIVPELAISKHANIIFIPMYDSCRMLAASFWKKCAGIKVICFSSALYAHIQKFPLKAAYVKYFPNPFECPTPVSFDKNKGIRPFFWQRRHEITTTEVMHLLHNTKISHFHLHTPNDPLYEKNCFPDLEIDNVQISRTNWFENKDAYFKAISACNVFISPRLYEGIGMSFLEAMGAGMLVVAYDNPTMNEYIISGENGIFYKEKFGSLDLTTASRLGARARAMLSNGYNRWNQSMPEIINYIISDTVTVAKQKIFYQPVINKQTNKKHPVITVATVVYNSADALNATIASVRQQTYSNIEYIIIDGGSTDRTIEVIKKNGDIVSKWISGSDKGPFDAMNKAAEIASGHWIIFMNAGDYFFHPDSLSELVQGAELDDDIVYGHHIYVDDNNRQHIHWVSGLDHSFHKLREGDVSHEWLNRIPCHQSTMTKVTLLRKYKYDLNYKIASDHNFMYNSCQSGHRTKFVDTIVSIYSSGGLSWKNQISCEKEWRKIALTYISKSNRQKGRRYFDKRIRDAIIKRNCKLSLGNFLLSNTQYVFKSFFWKELFRRGGNMFSVKKVVCFHSSGTHNSEIDWVDFQGISSPEPWGSWTDDDEVFLHMPLCLKSKGSVNIVIKNVFPPNVGKKLTIMCNGETSEYILKEGAQIISLKVAYNTELKLHLRIPKATSPKSLGWGDDQRRLGVGLHSLEIT